MKYLVFSLLFISLCFGCIHKEQALPKVPIPLHNFNINLGDIYKDIKQPLALAPLTFTNEIATAKQNQDGKIWAVPLQYEDQQYQLHSVVRSFNFNRKEQLVRVNLSWMEIEEKNITPNNVKAIILALSDQQLSLQDQFSFPNSIQLPFEQKIETDQYYQSLRIDKDFINYEITYQTYGANKKQ